MKKIGSLDLNKTIEHFLSIPKSLFHVWYDTI